MRYVRLFALACCVGLVFAVPALPAVAQSKYFDAAGAPAIAANGTWSDQFGPGNGIDGYIYAIAIDDTGNVYVGGNFTEAGGVEANSIARWTGTTWEALGDGVDGAVLALALSPSGALYAGGDFTEAGNTQANAIARWTGASWESLGDGLRNPGPAHPGDPHEQASVYAIAFDSTGTAYVGGNFTRAGSTDARGITTWDGEQWDELGSGVGGGGCVDSELDIVFALAIDSVGAVYAGGNFVEAGGVEVHGIAKWTGEQWEALGSGVNVCASIQSIAFWGDDLFVGGDFTQVGNVLTDKIAKWTGDQWEALGTGVRGGNATGSFVHAIIPHESGLFVGGRFTEAGGKTVNSIAKWTGEQWEALGSGIAWPGSVLAMGIHDHHVYVGGGGITEAGGKPSLGIALWHETMSTPIEPKHNDDTSDAGFNAIYPAPFRDQVTILFSVPAGTISDVHLEVYNALGQRAATLVHNMLAPGEHTVTWSPSSTPAGVYTVRLHLDRTTYTRTIVKIQ